MSSSAYKDGLAILDHLILGKALPDHIAARRVMGGVPTDKNEALAEQEAREQRNRLKIEVAESLTRSPLVAVCYDHTCACGNHWRSFGFYARKVTTAVPGQGTATFTKRIEHTPTVEERVTETQVLPALESACINCFGGSILDVVPTSH